MTKEEQFAKDLADCAAYKAQRKAVRQWHGDEFVIDKEEQCIVLNRAYPDENGVYEIPPFVSAQRANYLLSARVFLYYEGEHLVVINHHNRIENMGKLFQGCSKLKSIDLSQFDTSNVIFYDGMFSRCSNLKEVDLSNCEINNAENLSHLFNECQNLERVKFNINGSIGDISGMFCHCYKLKSVDFSNAVFSHADMKKVFFCCQNLESVIYRGAIEDWQDGYRPILVRDFVRAYNNGEPYSKEIVKVNNAYIKRSSEEYFGFNDENREVFTYMLENKLITPKKLSMMLDRPDATAEERAVLLEYQRKHHSKRRSDSEYSLD